MADEVFNSESCLPETPCQDGVSLDVPNTHLFWGYTSAPNNKVRSDGHCNSIFVFVDWLSLGSLVDLRQRENFLRKKLIVSSWEVQMGTPWQGRVEECKGGARPRAGGIFTSHPHPRHNNIPLMDPQMPGMLARYAGTIVYWTTQGPWEKNYQAPRKYPWKMSVGSDWGRVQGHLLC